MEKHEEVPATTRKTMPVARSIPTCLTIVIVVLQAFAPLLFGQEDVLYQVSTLDALVSGVFDGETTLADLANHGDFGLGTFNAVDGEMVLIDGFFYRIDGTGQVRPAGMTEKTPFAAVTSFQTDLSLSADSSMDQEAFYRFLDSRLVSANLFYAVRIQGAFRSVKTRSVPRQDKPYRPLTEIVKTQPVFEYENIRGVMAGFRCPASVKGLNFTGYHLHFLAREAKGGGHVLGFVTDGVRVDVDRIDGLQLKLPADPAFLKADLSPDRSADAVRVEK
jgi:acetolactate decarboxylase